MAINERIIHTASAAAGGGASGNQEEGLMIHYDANNVDSYDGDGTVWYDIADYEYTPATDVSEHFNTVLFQSNNAVAQSITGVGFKPDLIIGKTRQDAASWDIYDSLRGVSSYLGTNLNNAEATGNYLDSFDDDGFSLGTASNFNYYNNRQSVAFCLKAGGAPTASKPIFVDGTGYATLSAAGLDDSTNTNYTSLKLSVNTDLGFSIVKANGPINPATARLPHGLGQEPEMVIHKASGMTYDWGVWHKDLPSKNNRLRLNQNAASDSFSNTNGGYWTGVNSTDVMYLQDSSNRDQVYYSFVSKRGVSKIGSYIGNGGTTSVDLGFKPAFVMVKRHDSTGDWVIYDNKRGGTKLLFPYLNYVEGTYTATYNLKFETNGFSISSGYAVNGGKYIYMAFAERLPTELTPSRADFTEETVTSGADLELKANDYSGSGNWLDNSGNSNDGTITGATYVNDSNSDYFDFDGSGDVITATGDITTTDRNFTVEAWVKPDSTSGQNFFEVEDTSGNRRISMVVNTGSKFRCYIYEATNFNNSAVVTSTTAFTTGEWYHIAVTFEQGVAAKMYVNGSLEHNATSNVTANRAQTYGETNLGDGAFGDFNGGIAQYRFYSKTLTASEVKTNYDATKGFYQYPNLVFDLDLSTSTLSNATTTGATYDEELGNFYSFTRSQNSNKIEPTANVALTDRTVEMWINPTFPSSGGMYVLDATPDRGYGADSYGNWAIYINSTNIVFVSSKYSGSTYGGYYGPHGISTGEWAHIAMTCSGTTTTGYVNGVEISEVSSSSYNKSQAVLGTNLNTTNLGFTRDGGNNSTYGFDGKMGQVRIYDTVLTQEQVVQNYKATIHDYPNSIDATAANSPTWNAGGYWEFDGGTSNCDAFFLPNSLTLQPWFKKVHTVSMWVNFDSFASYPTIWATYDYYGGASWGTLLRADNDGRMRQSVYENNVARSQFSSTLYTGQWYHVVASFSQGDNRLYIDNSLIGTTTNNFQYPAPGGRPSIGALRHSSATTTDNGHDGKISKFKLYDRFLTTDEIQALYNEGE